MRKVEPLDLALLVIGGALLVALALTERYEQLLAAVAAYAASWWVLGLERHRSGDRT